MDGMDLKGKTALVTGASRGIGQAAAQCLADLGANVILTARTQDAADAAAEQLSGAVGFGAHAADEDAARRCIDFALERFGRLDILVNNASNFLHADFASITEEIWDAALDVNLKAPFFCSQAAAPLLKKNNGVIINLSDVAGFLGWTGYIPHSVSKAGVSMLTRVLAKALAPEIRVNAIAPGTITMPGDPPDLAADFIKRAPLQRTGTTDDVTSAISFLINSPFITGEVLLLDGGRTL
jgi:NAD(P)-dependent dehydrogenase (short-subunit alcohol dehydrogenase family)